MVDVVFCNRTIVLRLADRGALGRSAIDFVAAADVLARTGDAEAYGARRSADVPVPGSLPRTIAFYDIGMTVGQLLKRVFTIT